MPPLVHGPRIADVAELDHGVAVEERLPGRLLDRGPHLAAPISGMTVTRTHRFSSSTTVHSLSTGRSVKPSKRK